MKILIISEFFPSGEALDIKGGVETRAFAVACELAKKHDVTVIASREKGMKRVERFANMTVIRCGPERAYTQRGGFLARLRFLWDAYRTGIKLKPDLVDGYNFVTYVPAMWLGKKLGIPAIATYHDVWVGEWIKHVGLVGGIVGELLERYILRGKGKHFTHFITNSNCTRNELISLGIPSKKVTTAYSGVYIDDYKKIIVEKYNNPTVVYVGRLVSYKRVNDLILAIKIVRQQIPNISCKIIGEGPEKDFLAKLVKENSLEDAVEFVGLKNHDEAMALIKKSHLLSLPSEVEGLGLVTIEAMACEVPYVSSRIPPTMEATAGGKGGILYETGNVQELAAGIVRLLNDKQQYAACVAEQKSLVKKYDWKKIGLEIEQIYESIISGKN